MLGIFFYFEPSGSIFLFQGFSDKAIGKPVGTCASHKFESSAVDWESACFKRTAFSFSVSVGNYLFSLSEGLFPHPTRSLFVLTDRTTVKWNCSPPSKKECGKPNTLVKIGKRIAISFSSRKKMDNVFSHKRVHRPFLSLQSNEEVPKSGNFFYSFLVFVGKRIGGGYVVKPKGRREEDNCS